MVMLAAGVIAAAGWQALDGDMRALIKSAPTSSNVLFWTVDQRDAGFRMLDRLGWLVEARIISRGNVPARVLPTGDPLTLDFDLDAY
ncbi:MAG: serine hydrolase, partial [Alteraurantiacibacter sp.]|nr:serine hydrolase [Alteraurantiacibacter sp.]